MLRAGFFQQTVSDTSTVSDFILTFYRTGGDRVFLYIHQSPTDFCRTFYLQAKQCTDFIFYQMIKKISTFYQRDKKIGLKKSVLFEALEPWIEIFKNLHWCVSGVQYTTSQYLNTAVVGHHTDCTQTPVKFVSNIVSDGLPPHVIHQPHWRGFTSHH